MQLIASEDNRVREYTFKNEKLEAGAEVVFPGKKIRCITKDVSRRRLLLVGYHEENSKVYAANWSLDRCTALDELPLTPDTPINIVAFSSYCGNNLVLFDEKSSTLMVYRYI